MQDNNKEKIDVSIAIPVFNERAAVRKCIIDLKSKMDTLPYKYEIIIVDDGSTDGSMDEIKDLPVTIIKNTYNRGGGVCRVIGMQHARGDIILQTDADGTYPVDNIDKILEELKTADIVIGSRTKETQKKFYLLRIFMKWFIRKIAEFLVKQKIPDLNSGLRAYRKDIAMKYIYLYPAGHSIMSTMTIAFILEGFRVKFVPIEYQPRIGRTSFNIVKDTWSYLQVTLTTVVFFNPLRVLMPVALSIILMAIGFTIRDVMRLGLGPLTVLLWILAVLIIILAIISEQIMRLSKYLAYFFHEKYSKK